jgi:hypothetical protein
MNTSHQRFWAITGMAAVFALSGCNSIQLNCSATADIRPEQLHGFWKVRLGATDSHWTLQLGPHPEHRGSLRGELSQGALRYPVVADLDGQDFTLEESHDGQRIAATWLGEVVTSSCGQTLRGERIGPQERREAFDMQR